MAKADQTISFSTRIGKLDYLLNATYLEIPSAVIKKLGGGLKHRLIVTVNDKLSYQGGLMPLSGGNAYITINSARMKKLGLKYGDKVNVKLEKDESEYGMPMPEELQELFAQDAEGKRRFDLLTPGKQRYILQYVGAVKNSQKRIDRAILLITNLKKSKEGKESFRQMLGLE